MIRRTVRIVVPVEVAADTEEGVQRAIQCATEELHVGVWGCGVSGTYEYRSQAQGREVLP